MPYSLGRRTERCIVCNADANILRRDFDVPEVVDCYACGDYQVSREAVDDVPLPITDPKLRVLATHTIRRMQARGTRAILTMDFFRSLRSRTLPTPAEATDNFITWLAEGSDGRPGAQIEVIYFDTRLQAIIGVIDKEDIGWIVQNLLARGVFRGNTGIDRATGHLTDSGRERYEDIKRARVASSFAFFARKFDNADLDRVFETCLRPAVEQTGYTLRTVTQRAGLVDAIIEDEIRRCRFLIADLSDENAGAYWEAGFAEGLGKPVIYLCRAGRSVHFDTDHRHTVKWDPASLGETAKKLKAVIRNTLLGDAKHDD